VALELILNQGRVGSQLVALTPVLGGSLAVLLPGVGQRIVFTPQRFVLAQQARLVEARGLQLDPAPLGVLTRPSARLLEAERAHLAEVLETDQPSELGKWSATAVDGSVARVDGSLAGLKQLTELIRGG
jgi:hypothetical protein